jgi:hypothetical protein
MTIKEMVEALPIIGNIFGWKIHAMTIKFNH